ncbi:Vacuolar protein sorting-associated protein 18 homolog, partial [Durusdinium trenchii]
METFLEQGSRSTHDAQIFATLPVEVEGGRSQRRLSRLAAASGSVLAAFQGGEVARWYPDEDEFALIDFKEQVGEVSRVFLDVTGFHALLTNSSGDSWYLNFQSTQALRLSKLKGHVLESASWDVEATTSSTRDLLLGTRAGQILQVVIESKEKSIKTLCEFERAAPVVGLRRERVFSTEDGLERLVLFAAAGCSLYAFVGAGSLESLFQRYQGERVTSRARIYEVPFDSPYGDLQVDEACVGPPGTKVLFWLTGVGVLAAKVLSMTKDAAGSTCLLESPPGLVPFPSKTGSGRTGVVSSFLPAPPPPAPRSMALTKFHLIFAFEDRWVAVSRITHEVVQQQDWAMSTYGPLRCLARDWHGEKLWLCSERHAFEVKIHQEER